MGHSHCFYFSAFSRLADMLHDLFQCLILGSRFTDGYINPIMIHLDYGLDIKDGAKQTRHFADSAALMQVFQCVQGKSFNIASGKLQLFHDTGNLQIFSNTARRFRNEQADTGTDVFGINDMDFSEGFAATRAAFTVRLA